MKKLAIALLIGTLLLLSVPKPADAGSSTDIALGLASFAVFNQLFGGFGFHYPRQHVVRYYVDEPQVVYVRPYIQQPVYVAPSVATVQAPSVIYYPHGRHELRGYGWVWIPNPPAPPALAAACPLGTQPTGKYVNTTLGLLPECG